MISISNKKPKHYCATTVQVHNKSCCFSLYLDLGFVCLFVSKKKVVIQDCMTPPSPSVSRDHHHHQETQPRPPAGTQQHTRHMGPSCRKSMARGYAPRPMLAVLLLLNPLLKTPCSCFVKTKRRTRC